MTTESTNGQYTTTDHGVLPTDTGEQNTAALNLLLKLVEADLLRRKAEMGSSDVPQ